MYRFNKLIILANRQRLRFSNGLLEFGRKFFNIHKYFLLRSMDVLLNICSPNLNKIVLRDFKRKNEKFSLADSFVEI